jgi:hypothetical protein
MKVGPSLGIAPETGKPSNRILAPNRHILIVSTGSFVQNDASSEGKCNEPDPGSRIEATGSAGRD